MWWVTWCWNVIIWRSSRRWEVVAVVTMVGAVVLIVVCHIRRNHPFWRVLATISKSTRIRANISNVSSCLISAIHGYLLTWLENQRSNLWWSWRRWVCRDFAVPVRKMSSTRLSAARCTRDVTRVTSHESRRGRVLSSWYGCRIFSLMLTIINNLPFHHHHEQNNLFFICIPL